MSTINHESRKSSVMSFVRDYLTSDEPDGVTDTLRLIVAVAAGVTFAVWLEQFVKLFG